VRISPSFEERVLDALMDYPQTASDLADRLEHHVNRVHDCLRILSTKGLVEPAGNVKRNALWRMKRTRPL